MSKHTHSVCDLFIHNDDSHLFFMQNKTKWMNANTVPVYMIFVSFKRKKLLYPHLKLSNNHEDDDEFQKKTKLN